MSILREIQATILSHDVDLATALLKLRFLASRLGSEPLEEWVKHEAEGYPPDVDVPPYRQVSITYSGTWSGPGGSGIQNAPIPSHLIEQYASEKWIRQSVRESIAGVEELAKAKNLGIDASNLILLLQGKVYPGWACNSVSGTISTTGMTEIKNAVRARILELTLQLEKSIPSAVDITLQQSPQITPVNTQAVTQIFNQTINGNFTNVTASGNAAVALSIVAGDMDSLRDGLMDAGFAEDDAKEFAQIVASERPESRDRPFGKKALDWIGDKAPKAAGGIWKIGSKVATDVLTEAVMKYYGLKP